MEIIHRPRASHIQIFVTPNQSDVHPSIRLTLTVVIALLSGCAESTGILAIGRGIYTVSEQFAAGRGGSLAVEQTALNEASTFCGQQGRIFLAVDTATPAGANPPGQTGYSATFRCVPPADPAPPRASSSGPDAIIEALRDYAMPDCDGGSPALDDRSPTVAARPSGVLRLIATAAGRLSHSI